MLTQQQLAAHYAVSRIVVRDVQQQLMSEGWLSAHGKAGMQVAGFSAAEAEELCLLRLQLERMTGAFVPSIREYYRFFGLNAEKLKLAKPDAMVMHPGPMNRGIEIDSDVADGAQSVIREQVEMGVAVRMAVLDALSRNMGGGGQS